MSENQELITLEELDEEEVGIIPYTPSDYNPYIEALSKATELANIYSGKGMPSETAKDLAFESMLWGLMATRPIPDEVIKRRKGADGNTYEYVQEFYVRDELDRFFPGWWEQGMETKYIPEIRTYQTSGYLGIEYSLPSGKKKERLVYAVGAAEVFRQRENSSDPSQPADRAKASYTVWLKLAAKQLGIAREIYSQKIPPLMVKRVKDYTKTLSKSVLPGVAQKYIDALESIEKPSGIRSYMGTLPNESQIIRLSNALTTLAEKVTDDGVAMVWNEFFKQNNSTNTARAQLEKYIEGFEKKAETFKIKKSLETTEGQYQDYKPQ